jgi:general secretion pathway protein B
VSYILDALRKSEQERLRGAAPGVLTVHMPSEADSQPAYLIYGLLVAAFISSGVAIGWWRPWQQAHELSAPVPVPVATTESTSRSALPERPPVLPEVGEAGQQTPVLQQQTPMPEPAVRVEPPVLAPRAANPRPDRARAAAETRKLLAQTVAVIPQERAAPAPETTVAPVAEKTAAPVQEKSADTTPADTPQQQAVIVMAELPPAILQELPAMSIPVHTYSSTPGERIVGINDRLLQEGDYLAPGLKLEQIAPDGVVFSYKKYLFRRGVP